EGGCGWLSDDSGKSTDDFEFGHEMGCGAPQASKTTQRTDQLRLGAGRSQMKRRLQRGMKAVSARFGCKTFPECRIRSELRRRRNPLAEIAVVAENGAAGAEQS